MAIAQDRTHTAYAQEAEATGAAALARRVYQGTKGALTQEEQADAIFRALRAKGHSYTLSAHVAWTYA
jgi:hypothetical protein